MDVDAVLPRTLSTPNSQRTPVRSSTGSSRDTLTTGTESGNLRAWGLDLSPEQALDVVTVLSETAGSEVFSTTEDGESKYGVKDWLRSSQQGNLSPHDLPVKNTFIQFRRAYSVEFPDRATASSPVLNYSQQMEDSPRSEAVCRDPVKKQVWPAVKERRPEVDPMPVKKTFVDWPCTEVRERFSKASCPNELFFETSEEEDEAECVIVDESEDPRCAWNLPTPEAWASYRGHPFRHAPAAVSGDLVGITADVKQGWAAPSDPHQVRRHPGLASFATARMEKQHRISEFNERDSASIRAGLPTSSTVCATGSGGPVSQTDEFTVPAWGRDPNQPADVTTETFRLGAAVHPDAGDKERLGVMPELGSPELPTAGSAGHGLGDCRPCAFIWKDRGCHRGLGCPFCHLCDAGERKKRAKQKDSNIKMRRRLHEGLSITIMPRYAGSFSSFDDRTHVLG
uniref:C3H1-type domain-containing protein n=1 Tax=Noctiluca scintillans TaxID=2966 RepID=A0A7S0ZUQ9_NOCSC|mmetsp:Transcript_19742/g.52763  ORF Transcript_19742/g.52763 Transcript_19742/m.52763 type:complete len:454 (+) Transcript_19742:81-1442(+)